MKQSQLQEQISCRKSELFRKAFWGCPRAEFIVIGGKHLEKKKERRILIAGTGYL